MKKDVSEWRPRGLNEAPGLNVETIDGLAQTLSIAAPDVMDTFRARLSGIAQWYRLAEPWRDAPPPSETRKKIESIRNTARRLAAQLGVAPLPDEDFDPLDQIPYVIRNALMPAAESYGAEIGGYEDHPPTVPRMLDQSKPFTDYHGDSKLAGAIQHVQLISAWCERAIEATRQKEKEDAAERMKRHHNSGPQARNSGNEPLNDMIARLGILYRDVTGSRPGISRPRGARGKPGGPFFRFVLAVCEGMQVPMTATALEKRWRTIGPLVRESKQIEQVLDQPKQGSRSQE